MRPFTVRTCATALAVCLFAGASARADFVDWSYNWTPSATDIFATKGDGKIAFSNEPAGSANGYSYIVATNLKAASGASASTPATFTKVPYSVTLTITDGPSGKSDSMTFSGMLNGTLSQKSAVVLNSFTGDVIQSKTIGDHVYTVNIGPFAPPGPPTSKNLGSISALVGVNPREVPEPSTLALSGVCLSLFGAGWWWRTQRRRLALAA